MACHWFVFHNLSVNEKCLVLKRGTIGMFNKIPLYPSGDTNTLEIMILIFNHQLCICSDGLRSHGRHPQGLADQVDDVGSPIYVVQNRKVYRRHEPGEIPLFLQQERPLRWQRPEARRVFVVDFVSFGVA